MTARGMTPNLVCVGTVHDLTLSNIGSTQQIRRRNTTLPLLGPIRDVLLGLYLQSPSFFLFFFHFLFFFSSKTAIVHVRANAFSVFSGILVHFSVPPEFFLLGCIIYKSN